MYDVILDPTYDDKADFQTLSITFCSLGLRSFLLGPVFHVLFLFSIVGIAAPHCLERLFNISDLYIYPPPLQLPAVFSGEVRG